MSEWKTRITKVQAVKAKHGEGEACLVLIYPPGPEMGKRWPLGAAEVVVGRGSDSDIQIDRDSVSRKHARFFLVDGKWHVEDLGSTNGSYINDLPVQRSPLRDSDFVKIGSAIFKFLSGSGVETAYHEEIYKMTIIDGLTGAHNKRYFLEFLEREIARCARYGRPLSLLLLDIDHFKKINDTHGHLTGDHVLKEMSGRLLSRVRKEELFARYGGEEFALVLPETGHQGAMKYAEQIRSIVERDMFEYEGDSLRITVSIGVSTLEGTPEDASLEPSAFIRSSDENLFKAKKAGRNRVVG